MCKEYDNCAVRTPRSEYEAKVASCSISPAKDGLPEMLTPVLQFSDIGFDDYVVK